MLLLFNRGLREFLGLGSARASRAGDDALVVANFCPSVSPRRVRPMSKNTEHSTKKTPNIKHRTPNTEHPTFNIQHPTSNIQRPTPNAQCPINPPLHRCNAFNVLTGMSEAKPGNW